MTSFFKNIKGEVFYEFFNNFPWKLKYNNTRIQHKKGSARVS